MREYLSTVDPALLFLIQATSSREHRETLEKLRAPDELVSFAAERGFEVTTDTLSEAMKILVDRKLEKEGIPSWVRGRLGAV
jgi:hypothetical protein